MMKIFKQIIIFLIILNFNQVSSLYCSAGILPYAVKDGKVFLLLGRSQHRRGGPEVFGDFGGRVEGQESYINTAAREGSEETLKLFGVKERLEKNLQNVSDNHIFIWDKNGKNHYYCYLLKVPYVSPEIFLNVQESSLFSDRKYQEISAFAWVDAEELLKEFNNIKGVTKDNWRDVCKISVKVEDGEERIDGTRKSISGKKVHLFNWFVRTLMVGKIKSSNLKWPYLVIDQIVQENSQKQKSAGWWPWGS
ncbi:MAG: NUDIX hydrolase [bacterium]